MSNGMGCFQRGNNALGLGKSLESGERFVVGGVNVFDPFFVAQVTVLGADSGVIKASRDGVRELDLSIFVCEDECLGALENAKPAALKARGVFAGANPLAASFHADHTDGF